MQFANMPGHLIRRMQQQSTRVFQARVRAAGLDVTSVQFAALEAIDAQPGLDQASLSDAIAYDRATIGGVVERMAAKGWITRSVCARDRRARVLHLSPEGRALLEQLRPIVMDVQDDIIAALSADEREAFLTLARKVAGL